LPSRNQARQGRLLTFDGNKTRKQTKSSCSYFFLSAGSLYRCGVTLEIPSIRAPQGFEPMLPQVIRSRCAARVKFSSSAKITTEYKCRTSTWGSIGLKPWGHEYLEFPELPHIYIRNLRTEKSMNKNFWSVYGFYSHQKEVVCLDAPDFSMAGYSHGSAGVS